MPQNLSIDNVTSNSAVLRWTFNRWDVRLLRGYIVEVPGNNNAPISRYDVNINRSTSLNQIRPITGLLPCSSYLINITFDVVCPTYTAGSLPLRTPCLPPERGLYENLMIGSCGVLMGALLLLLMVVCAKKCDWWTSGRDRGFDESDIIDVREVGGSLDHAALCVNASTEHVYPRNV